MRPHTAAMQATPLNSALFATSKLWADSQHVPVQLVRAHIQEESGGIITAWKTEPQYRYLWDCRNNRPFRPLTPAEIASEINPRDFSKPEHLVCSVDTEWWGQQASWGPMQVMGAVARSYGFDQHFPALCDPSQGVHLGVMHLAHLIARYQQHFGWEGVAAAYNAGSPRRDPTTGKWVNQQYVDNIRAYGGFEGLA